MKILIACEESQTVCIEMRKLGHEAYSADIQECSGGRPEWHIKGDVIPLINGDCEFTTMDGKKHKIEGQFDLLISHPPCTYISNAGARWLFPNHKLNIKKKKKGLEAKDFFMKFWNAKCDKIVIENPVPSKIFDMPEPTQIIQPYEYYGEEHPYTKKTQLWERGVEKIETRKSG